MSIEQPESEERPTGSEESLLDRMVPNGDATLRRAEGRVQGAESKAAELEAELASMRAANVRMEEQLKRLWGQLGMPTERSGPSKWPVAPRGALGGARGPRGSVPGQQPRPRRRASPSRGDGPPAGGAARGAPRAERAGTGDAGRPGRAGGRGRRADWRAHGQVRQRGAGQG